MSSSSSRAKLLVNLAAGNKNDRKLDEFSNTDVFNSTGYNPTFTNISPPQSLAAGNKNDRKLDEFSNTDVFNSTGYNPTFTNISPPQSLAAGNKNDRKLDEFSNTDVFNSTGYNPTFTNISPPKSSNIRSEARSSSAESLTILQNVPLFFERQSNATEKNGGNNQDTLNSSNLDTRPTPDVILDEVTRELIETEEPIIIDDTYYLNETTGLLEKINTSIEANEANIDSFSFESENPEAQEHISKQKKINVQRRVHGKGYTGRKRRRTEEEGKYTFDLILKPKKNLKPKLCVHTNVCKSDRSFVCGAISETKRKEIFDYFWDLSTWEAKKAYLKNLVRMRTVIRRRKSNSNITSQKQLAYDYYLPDDDNNTLKVCKHFFINTFSIQSDTLTEWIKVLQDPVNDQNLKSRHEKRKLKSVTNNNLTVSHSNSQKSETIQQWLSLLEKVPSHYCRSSSNRIYVEDTFESKSHMHKIFTKWCQDNEKPSCGRKLFIKILQKEKISIFKPRKDQCDVCSAKKEGNLSEEDYAQHLLKKNEAKEAHTNAKAMNSSEVLVLTVDVQSVLLCPKLLVSAQYYKQKLQLHNQSIYIHNNKDVCLYVWHEGDGGVTANEFTSCLVEFIKTQLKYKKVIIISDGCSYQNKNKILSSALLNLSIQFNIEIEQLILEKGHTMMQVDSVHSTLEKKFRPPLYAPSDYISRMHEARPKQPYTVHHVDYTFFKNYEKVLCLDSIRPGKKVRDPTVNDIRALLYKNGSIFYKLRHPDEWQILPQRIHSLHKVPLVLYNEPRKIEKSKFESLQSLKPYMHRDYHTFYDSLLYKQ